MKKVMEIRKAIDELSSEDARTALKLVMFQIDLANGNKQLEENIFHDLKQFYDDLLLAQNNEKTGELRADAAKIHILFGDSAAGSLRYAVKQMGLSETNKVVSFNDSYSIGPIWQLHKEEGRKKRYEWLRDHINNGYDSPEDDLEEEVYPKSIIAQIPAEASIVLWVGNNAHDYAGLRYTIYLLRNCMNKVFVFNAEDACSRRFNTPDRFIDYIHLGEVPIEKLQAVFGESEENGPLSRETREQLEHEWIKLAEQQEVLRIWNDNKLVGVDEHYFDNYLLETVEQLLSEKPKGEFIKAARVVGQALGYCEQYVGDQYFEYRLRELIYTGKLEIKGVPRAMRFYSVRLK